VIPSHFLSLHLFDPPYLYPTNIATSNHSLATLQYFHNKPELPENSPRDSPDTYSPHHYRSFSNLGDETTVLCQQTVERSVPAVSIWPGQGCHDLIRGRPNNDTNQKLHSIKDVLSAFCPRWKLIWMMTAFPSTRVNRQLCHLRPQYTGHSIDQNITYE
jgi:hypothetical protein